MSGPRIKRTLDTAGDLALAELLRARLRERLRQQLVAATLAPTISGRAAAAEWIFDHGGTIAAALKATHPDTGGTKEDFMRTIEARDVLEGR